MLVTVLVTVLDGDVLYVCVCVGAKMFVCGAITSSPSVIDAVGGTCEGRLGSVLLESVFAAVSRSCVCAVNTLVSVAKSHTHQLDSEQTDLEELFVQTSLP